MFTSIPWVSYPIVYATSDVIETGDNWALSHPIVPFNLPRPSANREPPDPVSNKYQNFSTVYALHDQAKGFTRWERKDCLQEYIDPLKSTRALLLVASNVTAAENNGSSLIGTWISGWYPWNRDNQWICRVSDMDSPHFKKWCTWGRASQYIDEWVVRYDHTSMLVDHCLVGEAGNNDQRCGLHYSAYILPIVCTSILGEGLLILWTWSRLRNPEKNPRVKTLITMGDAVAEFLEQPSSVEASETYTSNGVVTPRLNAVGIQTGPWSSERRVSWLKAVDVKTWIYSLLL